MWRPGFQSDAMKRVAVLPAIVLIQSCLGGVYAWTAFVPALTRDHGLRMSHAQLVFGLAILTFTVVMVFAGRLLTRWGPRLMALVSAAFFIAGHLIAAEARGRLLGLVVGYGLAAGAGIGVGYVTALTTGVRWFPQHKGLVTGVAVGGFGLAALVLAELVKKWTTLGWAVGDMFYAMAIFYGAVVTVGALLLSRPPEQGAAASAPLMATSQFLASKAFRVFWGGIFCGTFAGLLVIGLLKPMGLAAGLSWQETTRGIGALAVGNVAGRMVWGWLFDRIGRRTIPGSLIFLCVVIAALIGARFSAPFFVVTVALVGFGFGACFVVYAAQVAALYGAEQVGRLYPLVFLGYGVAGIAGPYLGGLLHDWTGSYTASLALSAGIAALGIILTRPLLTQDLV